METITGVPPESVGTVVQDFINDGAVHLLVERAGDGTYTITRTS